MRRFIILSAAMGLTACDPPLLAKGQRIDEPIEPAAISLLSYEASEFEPSWNLELSGGTLIEFSQLDPVSGLNTVTYSYTVTNQTAFSNGWSIQGSGSDGSINIIITDWGSVGCSHSGTGDNYRDKVAVTVTASSQVFNGCGGPII